MAGSEGEGPWRGMFMLLSNRTAEAQAVQPVIGCIPRGTAGAASPPVQTQTAALRQGTSVHREHCHSGHLVDGGATADFPGDQPPTQKQLDAVDLFTRRAGNELITKAEVSPEAATTPSSYGRTRSAPSSLPRESDRLRMLVRPL